MCAAAAAAAAAAAVVVLSKSKRHCLTCCKLVLGVDLVTLVGASMLKSERIRKEERVDVCLCVCVCVCV